MPIADYKADVEEIIGDIGETIAVAGESYTAVVSPADRGLDLGLAGVAPEDALDILILVDDFDTLPVIGDLVTYNSREYRVQRIVDSNDGEVKTLYGESRNR